MCLNIVFVHTISCIIFFKIALIYLPNLQILSGFPVQPIPTPFLPGSKLEFPQMASHYSYLNTQQGSPGYASQERRDVNPGFFPNLVFLIWVGLQREEINSKNINT